MLDRVNNPHTVNKQQLDSNSTINRVFKGDNKMNPSNQTTETSSEVEAELLSAVPATLEDMDDETSLDDEGPVQGEDTEEVRSIYDLFAGQESIRLVIEPTVLLTLSNAETELPSEVKLGKKHYSLDSAMRKGDGSTNDPAGFLRDGVSTLMERLGSMTQKAVVLFGETNKVESLVTNFVESLTGEVQTVLGAIVNGTDMIALPSKAENSLDEVGVTAVNIGGEIAYSYAPLSELFTVSCWPVIDSSENPNEYILNAVINISLNMPKLQSTTDYTKVMASIHRTLSMYATKVGLSADSVLVGMTFSRSDLTSPAVLNMLTDHSTNPEIQYEIFADSDCRELNERDSREILPDGLNSEDARSLLMPFGGDTILIASSYPTPPPRVKAKTKKKQA